MKEKLKWRETAIQIVLKSLKKRMTMWNLARNLPRAHISEGRSLNFFGFVISTPLMAILSDKWLIWDVVTTNKKRLLYLP